jgi:hypothetical protein
MKRFLLLPLLPGCIALAQLAHPGSAGPGNAHYISHDGHPARVGPYWGPECERIGEQPSIIRYGDKEAEPTMGKQPNLSHDPTDQILRLVCVEQILSSESEPERNTWVMQHFRFDEVFFDHLTASMMLVQCLEAGSCLGAPNVERPHEDLHNPMAEKEREEQDARPPNVWQYYEAGMMRWYADHVDLAEVGKKLQTIPLPQAARDAYMKLVADAQKGVIAMTDQLTPEAKQLFVDIPVKVFEARKAALAKNGKLVSELGELVQKVSAEREHGVSDDTIMRLTKLRLAYAATCHKDCTRTTLFVAITRQLFWSHVSRGDAPAAMVEAKLLEKPDPSAADEIADKQEKAIGDAIGRVSRVKSAREQGVDAASAQSTAHGSVLDLGDGRYVYRPSEDFAIAWESLVPNPRLASVDGKVAGIERHGASALVRFRDEVSSYSEGTNCYETGRIDSISSDGKINYRSECAGSETHTERHKVDPVTMPASEAAGLAAGDEVVGFSNADHADGRVWFVKRGSRLVRLRDVTL